MDTSITLLLTSPQTPNALKPAALRRELTLGLSTHTHRTSWTRGFHKKKPVPDQSAWASGCQ